MNPGTGFYARQLCRLTGRNVNAVRRELANLEDIGLLTSKSTGNTKTYTVNREMTIYQELSSIILKTEGVGQVLKDRIGEIGGIDYACVFGSFAMSEAGLSSDVDLLVVGEIDEDELNKIVTEIERRIGRNVNYVVYGRDEFNRRRTNGDPFISNIIANPRIDLVGSLK